jgi:hypothetical protein
MDPPETIDHYRISARLGCPWRDFARDTVHIRKGRATWVSKGDPLAQLQFIEELFGLAI